MWVFIDESGTFASSPGTSSVSLVGALVIAGGRKARIEEKYSALRRKLPTEGGEVKGRLLSEAQIDQVVTLLRKNEVLFEVVAIDLAMHSAEGIGAHKKNQEEGITVHLTPEFHPSVREGLWDLRRRLEQMPHQLYVQSVVVNDLVQTAIQHATLYFCQRRPEELGQFHWVIDGKDKDRKTDWEDWWSSTIMPFLQSRSLREPFSRVQGGDYSFFERFETPIPDHLRPHIKDSSKKSGMISLNKILTESFRFSSNPEPSLELVDILANATRRALAGRLGIQGWGNIRTLMIHRRDHYIKLVSLEDVPKGIKFAYGPVLRHFSRGGKDMIAPRFRNS